MIRTDLIKRMTEVLRESGASKHVMYDKYRVTILDDQGNEGQFEVKQRTKDIAFTANDVAQFIDAFLYVLTDAIEHGEEVRLNGYFTMGVKIRKLRRYRDMVTNTVQDVPEHYIPGIEFGNRLRRAAKIFDNAVKEGMAKPEIPPMISDEEWELYN